MPSKERVERDTDRKGGLKLANRQAVVALVGNPNSGKTSLFNALTGSNQHVGNYPGVTVERVEGEWKTPEASYKCIDVPGLYSMTALSADEEVATDVIQSGDHPDLLLCVLDATNLERNLFFFSQVVGAAIPTVLVLTMTDILAKEGRKVDTERLSAMLGLDVVCVVAHKRQGLKELAEATAHALRSGNVPEVDLGMPNIVREPVFRLHDQLARAGIDVTKSSVREALLNAAASLNRQLDNNPELQRAFVEERRKVLGQFAEGRMVEASARYAWARRVATEVLGEFGSGNRAVSDKIDRVLTHRVFGLLAFLGVMYVVFQSIYSLAAPLMSLIDAGFGWLADKVSPLLAGNDVVQSLVVDGVITGIGSVVVFLPQIMILFFFIAVLEGSGYLSRAAFLMDRLLGWCGLNGRAFIPLLSSFACAVPGIMAARVMPDHKSRLATVLVAPLMSCSARLPVYVLLIGVFVEPKYGPIWAGVALFAMHFVGLAVAIPTIWLLNRSVIRGKRLPFVLELPRYQWPRWRDVRLTVLSRAKVFLTTAGTIIFVLSIVIWALLYFPRDAASMARYRSDYGNLTEAHRQLVSEEGYIGAQQVRDSYLGRFGRALEPVFEPAGFDWRLTTSILAAFPAREVVVSAMGIIFEFGGDQDESSADLRESLARATWPDGRPLMTLATAASLMVFFALCAQCMATLAAIKRETGSWRWAAFSFGYMTVLAYIAAVCVYQGGSRIGLS